MQRVVLDLVSANSYNQTCQRALETIRDITGYSRAVMYELDANGNSKIIVQSKQKEIDNHLEVDFPLSPLEYDEITSFSKSGHNVRTSRSSIVTITLMKQNVLWGIINCHHYEPKQVSPDILEMCSYLGEFLSSQLLEKKKLDEYEGVYERAVNEKAKELISSAIKLEDERWQLVQEGNNDGIFDWNIHTGEAFFSLRYKQMLGYEDHELKNHYTTWENLVHIEDKERAIKTIQNYLNKGVDTFSLENRLLCKDGSYKWILARGKAIWDKEGNPVRMIGSHTDIHEQKKLEAQLRKSLLEKDILIKEIHHRVKNNMQIISSLLRLQSQNITNNEHLKIFQESQNRINSMALVHHHIYKSDDLEKINIADYIKNLVEGISQTYKNKEIKIDFRLEIGHIYLNIDQAISIGLIINELVTNSLKHAFATGNGVVTIIADRIIDESTNGTLIQIVISDNGIGISETVTVSELKSLGLQLVHDLVESQLNGTIELASNQGTCFTIKFRKDT